MNPLRDPYGSPQGKCLITMQKCNFTYEQRREWLIWAAKLRTCKQCNAEPGKPCMNLTSRKSGINKPTRNPHEGRVDWDRMLEGLKKREYYTGG